MLKVIKQSNKLNYAIILSFTLHVAFIGLLVVGSSIEPLKVEPGGSGTIDAVMIDPSIVEQQYQRIEEQKKTTKRAQNLNDNTAARQERELRDRQAADLRKLQQIEKNRLEAERKIKEAKKQAELAAQQKKKREDEAKKRIEAAAKEKIKKELEARKNELELDLLFNELVENKVSSSANQGDAINKNKNPGASDAVNSTYEGQIRNAIKNKLPGYDLYRGKTCLLRIKLAPDGLLFSATAEGGDPALCRVAEFAAKQANMPKPPNSAVYDRYKNTVLEFQPE